MRQRLAVDPDRVLDDLLALMFAPGDTVVEPPRERDRRILEQGLRFLERWSLRGREEAIRCPVRLLHGELDALCPLAAAELLAAALPNATLKVLPGAGHALPLSHSQQLRAWLEE
jgi:pimeloyl-[acyl-carrier protein] methyl ester esterase